MDQQPSWTRTLAHNPVKTLLLLLIITLITHLPTHFSSFVADDFMQWAMLEGSEELQQLGFTKANPEKPHYEKLLDSFHFFNPESATNAAYRNYGNLPWWSAAEASMVPFRPIAAASHWLDYHLFNGNLAYHRAHSLVYFLLLAVVAFALFKRFASREVALVATLFLIVDFSLTKSFNWVIARNSYMALAFGIVSILWFINWRERKGWGALIVSLFMLLVTLLTAEAGLSALAYMGAYVLCMEKHRSLLHKIPPLLPFIILVVIWRLAYNAAGFGSHEIGQYVDPVHSPLAFATNFIEVFPLICISQIIGVDSLIILIHPEKRLLISLAAWAIAIICVALIWPLLKRQAVTRFMFIGSIVAGIPGTALISGESRTVTFLSLGFFFILSQWLAYLTANKPNFFTRWSVRGVYVWHLFIPALLAITLTSNLSGFTQQSTQYESIRGEMEKGDRSLVIVNDSSGMYYYIPFEWAFKGYTLPQSINILTPGLSSFSLTRLNQRTFLIDAPAGIPVHHKSSLKSKSGESPLISTVYTGLFAIGFFTSVEKSAQPGQIRYSADSKIEILKTNEVGPIQMKVTFIGELEPDEKVWQIFDWQDLQYKLIACPGIGETIRILGPLDK